MCQTTHTVWREAVIPAVRLSEGGRGTADMSISEKMRERHGSTEERRLHRVGFEAAVTGAGTLVEDWHC